MVDTELKDLFTASGVVLDHVAIACQDLEATAAFYADLGFVFDDKREEVPSQGVITAFAPCDQRAHLELLAPLGSDGPISQFLQKKGPGIHHLCFRVKDIRSLSDVLTKKGHRFLYPQPVKGARDCWVNFLHPKSAFGVLIELSEAPTKEEIKI